MSDPFTSTHLASAFNGRRRLLFPFALVHVSLSNCIDFQLFFPAQNIINYYVNYFVTLSQECRLCWTLVCHVNSCLLWGQCRGAGGGRGKWKYPLQWQQEKSTATVLNGKTGTATRTATYVCVTVALRTSQSIQVLVFIDLQPPKKTPLRALIELRETWLDCRPLGAIPFTIEDQMDEYIKVPVNSLGDHRRRWWPSWFSAAICSYAPCVVFYFSEDLIYCNGSRVQWWPGEHLFRTRLVSDRHCCIRRMSFAEFCSRYFYNNFIACKMNGSAGLPNYQ